jgi:hypothetical protein
MKKQISIAISFLAISIASQAQTVPTTTITGNLKVSDSLHVINNISTKGSVSAVGDVTATGEVVAKDTMRAQKDILIDGNAVVGGNMKVAGTTSLVGLKVSGGLEINAAAAMYMDPCLKLLMTETTPTGTQHLVSLDALQIKNLENALDVNPCPTPPVIPFTWQTYGNHVNSNNRWIGTIENFDFNIRTNNLLRMNVKNNGTVNLFTLNATTTGALVIKNNDLNKNVFQVQSNGTTNIGIGRPLATGIASSAMLSVDGLILAKEVRVAISTATHWADYVFENNYKLMPLKDVESYIKKNKHLPEVPSAEEVVKEGIDVNEISATLLKKIEELTLYTIELKKEIELLKSKNK